MSIDKFRLLFFGSDAFSIRVLRPLLDLQACPIQILTKPQSLLSRYADQNNIVKHFWQPGLANLSDDKLNIAIVASFGQMIDPQSVNRFSHGMYNIHPSLLPMYRGSSPIQAAVFDKLSETGCTIMRIPPIKKFDVGDIVYQRSLAIKNREYAISLRDRLADLASSMLIEFLLDFDSYVKKIKPQSKGQESLARKLKPEQGCLRFKSEPSDLIDRKVLAYSGFLDLYTECLKGLQIELDGLQDPRLVETLEIDRLYTSLAGTSEALPGSMYFHKRRQFLCFKARDSCWMAFSQATPKGKPSMQAIDFYNGFLSKVPPCDQITDL